MQGVNRLPSDRLVQFITIVYSLTVTQGFVRYSKLILQPSLSLPFVALIAVFYAVMVGWVFYHRLLLRYPYEDSPYGLLRFVLDFAIVGVNAYLVFSVELIEADNNVRPYIIGFAAIFFLYILSGVIRQIRFRDRAVSLVGLIFVPFLSFLFLASIYPYALSMGGTWTGWLNWVFVLAPPFIDFAYRAARWQSVWR